MTAPTLQQISSAQASPEVPINENADATAPAGAFGRKATTTTGLTWGYYGGEILVDGVPTAIADGTVTLTGSATNYISISRAGVVAVAASRTVANAPLYTVVAGSSSVTSYTDERGPTQIARLTWGAATQAMADANQTITQAQALCDSITTTGALTAQRNLVVPLVKRQWTIRNNCTGHGVQAIGASGTGIVVAVSKTAIVECDGTNVVRVTADV